MHVNQVEEHLINLLKMQHKVVLVPKVTNTF